MNHTIFSAQWVREVIVMLSKKKVIFVINNQKFITSNIRHFADKKNHNPNVHATHVNGQILHDLISMSKRFPLRLCNMTVYVHCIIYTPQYMSVVDIKVLKRNWFVVYIKVSIPQVIPFMGETDC